ncbi:alpha/beta hydrolase [Streptomyces sp. 150FB]|uniref:alpha/beta fold hydrolase n=1 Tax=Streptomyces sp. 150FB TaxID=1576605 RepID=UPI000589461A|nr:alpha/beta hydrolase [Streptomyces sp. 150FB]KIF76776.1 alpha/beta hydrolase [Streptomyces sp. 150FB]
MRADTLRVPGATLYHEIRGSGPVLLLLPGAGGDAAVFDPVADRLAERFTVVAVDPRGYSRSRLDSEEPVDQRVETQSEDAYLLLEHLLPAGESAYVFGGSSGAIVALDLLARRPERLRLVVAHEPPCFAVLPDAAEQRAFIDEVYRLFHEEGPGAASAHFLAGIGGTLKPMPHAAELPPRGAEMMARLSANGPLAMENELRQFTSYVPDGTALAAVSDRLVLAAGRETRGHLPYRPAALLAERLGGTVTEFPGGHSGFTELPEEFTRMLEEMLSRR